MAYKIKTPKEKERDYEVKTTEKYKIKKVGEKYMLFDTQNNQFLIGYSFESDVEAYKFIENIEKKENEIERENTEEYFLGKDPRKHKDYKYFGGKE